MCFQHRIASDKAWSVPLPGLCKQATGWEVEAGGETSLRRPGLRRQRGRGYVCHVCQAWRPLSHRQTPQAWAQIQFRTLIDHAILVSIHNFLLNDIFFSFARLKKVY